MIWKTMKWELIKYEDLTDSHLLNIEQFILRRSKEWVKVSYWNTRDPDSMCVDIEYWEEVLDMLDYDWINEEIIRRWLTKKICTDK